MASAVYTCNSACQHASQIPTHTHTHTSTVCPPGTAWYEWAGESHLCSFSAFTKGALMNLFAFSLGELSIFSLLFSSSFDNSHSLFLLNRMPVLIISTPPPPPPHVRLSLTLHPLNQTSRQADLFTGVHSVLKHRWMFGGGKSSWEWIHDTRSIALQVSDILIHTLLQWRHWRHLTSPLHYIVMEVCLRH